MINNFMMINIMYEFRMNRLKSKPSHLMFIYRHAYYIKERACNNIKINFVIGNKNDKFKNI